MFKKKKIQLAQLDPPRLIPPASPETLGVQGWVEESARWTLAINMREKEEPEYGSIPIELYTNLDTNDGNLGSGFLLYSDRALYLAVQKLNRHAASRGFKAGTIRVPFEDINWFGPPPGADRDLNQADIQFPRPDGEMVGFTLRFTPLYSDLNNQLKTIQHLRNDWGGYPHPAACACHAAE